MSRFATPDSTMLYLVRHGCTPSNEQRPYVLQGSGIDHSLSARGCDEAARVGKFLSGVSIDHVYASPLKRAVETAQAIATPHGLDVATDERLHECHVGKWEGLSWDAIMSEFPAEYAAFMDNPAATAYLEGESYSDVLNRVRPAIEEILDRHVGRSVAIVAHNVVNRVYLAHLLGVELRRAKDIRQTNACVNVIRRRGDETELITLNACFHLE